MTSKKNEIQPEAAALRDKIAALDAELAEDFKAQFSVCLLYTSDAADE